MNPTDSDSNGHPDYVDAVADVFDDVRRHEITELGYLPPPSDDDGLFDIYIRDLSRTAQFGVTYPESFSNSTSPSYIEVDNNFTDPVYTTQGLSALRLTAAHEFFHAVQFRYYLSLDASWWYELTATWMQDQVFTEVNDHYVLVDDYLQLPEAAFYEPPPISLRPYGAMVLAAFLSSAYGETIIRETFEDLAASPPSPYTISDTDRGLPDGFAGVLPRYWIWNYFTGSRAQSGRYYPESSAYQAVNAWEITPIGSLALGGAAQVQSLGATYAHVNTAGKSGGLRVTFNLAQGPDWNLDVLLIDASGTEVIRPEGTTVTIPDAGNYEAVVLIPSVLSLEGQVYDVSYTVSMSTTFTEWSDLVGDLDRNGTVGFEDFVTFSDSFGKPARTHDSRSDFNADGAVDFDDFLIFARRFGDSR